MSAAAVGVARMAIRKLAKASATEHCNYEIVGGCVDQYEGVAIALPLTGSDTRDGVDGVDGVVGTDCQEDDVVD